MKRDQRDYGVKDNEESVEVGGGWHPSQYDSEDSTPFVSHTEDSDEDATLSSLTSRTFFRGLPLFFLPYSF